MRVRVTVFYGDEGLPLSKETKAFQILEEDEDEESFTEAKDYLAEAVLEPYSDDGYELEDDEEEEAIGTDYLAAWVLPTWFDTRAEAREFLEQIKDDCEAALSDLE